MVLRQVKMQKLLLLVEIYGVIVYLNKKFLRLVKYQGECQGKRLYLLSTSNSIYFHHSDNTQRKQIQILSY
ncbi:unnamed protein product [Paramecium sonneborni]|uniref:Uncharacterized protein n=1 Tax=Paramecium sonneborni TaxID=65129 RepID=A0A8S1RPV8_9CILI|nr:unnamed protein product [Paramecium sonneborni]